MRTKKQIALWFLKGNFTWQHTKKEGGEKKKEKRRKKEEEEKKRIRYLLH